MIVFLCVSCRKHLSYDVTIVTFRYKQYKLSLAFITAFSINSIKHVLEMFSLFLCLHEARLPDGGNMLSTCPSVRPSVRSSVTKLVNAILLKTNEPILIQIGTSGARGMA